MVGATGIEPVTPTMSTACATVASECNQILSDQACSSRNPVFRRFRGSALRLLSDGPAR